MTSLDDVGAAVIVAIGDALALDVGATVVVAEGAIVALVALPVGATVTV